MSNDDRLERATELRAIAEKLGVSIVELGRRIGEGEVFRKYVSLSPTGRRAADDVMLAARALVDSKTVDNWIVGDGDATGWRYVVHTIQPRFIAIMASRERIERIVWQDRVDTAAAIDLAAAAIKASIRAYDRAYEAGTRF